MSRRVVIWRWIVRPLALGVVTTMGVAWGLAAWLPQRDWNIRSYQSTNFEQQDYELFLDEYWTFGAVRRRWNWSHLFDGSFGLFFRVIETSRTGEIDRSGGPSRSGNWGRAERVRAASPGEPFYGCEHATGWPFLAAWYEFEDHWDPENPVYEILVHGGIPLQRAAEAPAIVEVSTLRALPCRPIWGGLIANSVVYGTVWFALFGGISAGAKRRRRRRGRCVGCGYDLRGLAAGTDCPECGRAGRGGAGPSPAVV